MTCRAPVGKAAPMTFIVFVIGPLVLFLCVLIFRINHVQHYAPQAYYRKKRRGAAVALEFESLVPRARKPPLSESGEDAG